MKIRLLCIALAAAALQAGNIHQDKLTEIRTGARREALASWWGQNPEDATATLQEAINSGVKKLTVDNTGTSWISGPLTLPGNLELVLADGVVLQARKGAFKGKNESFILIADVENVILRGEGNAGLTMNKQDYQNPGEYERSEWRHLVSLAGTRNVTIRDLTLRASGGDGIYITSSRKSGGRRFSEKTLIENISSLEHHRQGISIISAKDLLIRKSWFNQTSGTAPMCGIDFEPNSPTQALINCVVEDCEFMDNGYYGIALAFQQINDGSTPLSITFRRIRSGGNKNGSLLAAAAGGMEKCAPGTVNFEDCELSGPVRILNHSKDGFKLGFRNTVIRGNVERPFIEIVSAGSSPAGFHCENVRLTGNAPEMMALTVNVKPELTGNLTCGRRTVNLEEWSRDYQIPPERFVMGRLNINELTAQGCGPAGETPGNMRLRGGFRFLQYAKQGGRIDIGFSGKRLSKRIIPGRVKVLAPGGNKVLEVPLSGENETVSFTAPETGIYRLEGTTGGNIYRIESKHAGQGLVAERLYLCGAAGRLYFEAMPDVVELKIEVKGDGAEWIQASLIDPQGQVVKTVKTSAEQQALLLSHQRPYPERREIWSIEITGMVEDGSIALGAPLNPVVSESPEALVRHK